MSLDILFVAYNRLGFTRFSFEQLLVNTDWTLVDRLIVYDDESTDGTRDYLAEAVGDCPVEHEIRDVVLRSPPGVMNHYLQAGQAEWFAKIDNDIVVPPGWLTAMLSVLAFHPEVDLLGMEGGRTGIPGRDGHPAGGYDIELCSHIGGVGLLRRESFFKPGQRTLRRIPQRGRFGFTEWQLQHDDVVRAWIYPDLMVTALDMIPFEPWCGWSEEYVSVGWQRRWPTYDPRWAQPLWGWWPEAARTEEAECSTG